MCSKTNCFYNQIKSNGKKKMKCIFENGKKSVRKRKIECYEQKTIKIYAFVIPLDNDIGRTMARWFFDK